MASTPKAIAFSNAARDAALSAEIAYRKAKRLTEWWTVGALANEFPVGDTTIVSDGNLTHPLTMVDVRALYAQLADMVTDAEANTAAKLKTYVRAGALPDDWR